MILVMPQKKIYLIFPSSAFRWQRLIPYQFPLKTMGSPKNFQPSTPSLNKIMTGPYRMVTAQVSVDIFKKFSMTPF